MVQLQCAHLSSFVMGMAGRIPIGERRDPCRFVSALSSAFFEWALIILLFAYAVLSHVLTSFARYCKLRTPCLLCSRFEAFIGRGNPGLYKEFICNAHKLEVSSLACCRAHRRLANAREMCDGCLSSFMDRIDVDDGEYSNKVPILKKDLEPGSRSTKRCACCSVTFRNIPLVFWFVRSRRSVGADICGSQLRGGLAKGMKISSRARTNRNECDVVVYGEVNGTSEHEVPFSDNDESLAGCGDNKLKEQFASRPPKTARNNNVPGKFNRATLTDVIREKPIYPSSLMPQASISDAAKEVNTCEVEAGMNHPTLSEMTLEVVPTESSDTNFSPDFADTDHGEANKDASLAKNQLIAIKGLLHSPVTTEFVPSGESSRVSGQSDESKFSDASSSIAFLKHVKGYSNDRYESVLESLDGSFVSEIEGESEVERLKRQIKMDRKSMSILLKELEEERNASTIAVNQAMAMINRLQEEKAAMQMDAFQYLRMLEEQTEYDQEALQKLNDLLADRDREIEDLEAEVDTYRRQYGGEPLTGRVLESSFDPEEREFIPVCTPRFMRSEGRENGSTLVESTVLDFEDEKIYISECLRRLEKKLQQFCDNGVDITEDGVLDKSLLPARHATRSTKYSREVVEDNDCPRMDTATLVNSQSRELKTSQDSSLSIEDSHVHGQSSSPSRGFQFSVVEALKKSRLRSISFNERLLQMIGRRNEIVGLGNEISRLNSRLETLESDRSFLEHAVDSLKNESTGLQFIQEIVVHLRELRKFGIRH